MRFLKSVGLGFVLCACSSSTSNGAASSVGDAGADAAPACTPVAASSEIVTAKTDYGTMQGTLEVPTGCTGMPVVVILSGSGPQDRDGNTPGATDATDMYKELALGLRDAGYATLRFDDPGVAKSATAIPATESELTYDIETNAIANWIPVVRADARFGPLVLAGHSEGSLTAILLGQRGNVDAVVSLAGAGRPIAVVLREQLAPTLTPDQLAQLDAALAKLEAGQSAGLLDPPLTDILRVSVQPYMISWMKYDPKVEIAKLTIPTLIVQGKTDVQVTVDDANDLEAGKPDAKLVFIDDMCHVLKQASVKDATAQKPQYSDPTIPIHPLLVPTISDFLKTLSKP